jgi:hypothetical protein
MKNSNISLLLSPLFLVSLLVLGLNDWVLKSTFHNFLTGKLSDFAGVFALAIFVLAWLPIQKQHYKQGILWAIAIFFSWWKSPFSADFIAWWSLYIFPIHRVVDATDLFALFVLLFAAYYSTNYTTISFPKTTPYFVSFVACISLTACVKPQIVRLTIPRTYIIPKNVIDSIQKFDTVSYSYYFSEYGSNMAVLPIDSTFYCIKLNCIGGLIYDDYEQNTFIKDFENERIKPLLERQRLPINYFQIDSSNQQKINQTDQEGRKQGTWKFANDNIFYTITYQNDRLNGNYTVTKNHIDTLIKGQFENNIVVGMWTFYDATTKIKTNRLYEQGETRKMVVDKEEKNIDTRQILEIKVGWGLLFDIFIFILACLFVIKELYIAKKQVFPENTWLNGFLFIFAMPLFVVLVCDILQNRDYFIGNFVKELPDTEADIFSNLLQIYYITIIYVVHSIIWVVLRKYFTYKLLFWWFLAYLFFLITWRQFDYWQVL